MECWYQSKSNPYDQNTLPFRALFNVKMIQIKDRGLEIKPYIFTQWHKQIRAWQFWTDTTTWGWHFDLGFNPAASGFMRIHGSQLKQLAIFAQNTHLDGRIARAPSKNATSPAYWYSTMPRSIHGDHRDSLHGCIGNNFTSHCCLTCPFPREPISC